MKQSKANRGERLFKVVMTQTTTLYVRADCVDEVDMWVNTHNPEDAERYGGVSEFSDNVYNAVVEEEEADVLDLTCDIIVREIDWDTNDAEEWAEFGEPDLPETVIIPYSKLSTDRYGWVQDMDDDDISESVCEYLSDTYGFCVYNFNWDWYKG